MANRLSTPRFHLDALSQLRGALLKLQPVRVTGARGLLQEYISERTGRGDLGASAAATYEDVPLSRFPDIRRVHRWAFDRQLRSPPGDRAPGRKCSGLGGGH